MTENNVASIDVDKLEEYQSIARILHNVFCFYPNEALIDSFIENDVAQTWPVFAELAPEQPGQFYLQRYLQQWQANQLTELQLDYGNLYFGPGEPKAIPQGSAYLGEEQVHFDVSTLALVDFYKQHKVEFKLDMPQPVDHMGLFFSVLDSSFQRLIESERQTNKAELMQFIYTLLQKHFTPWASRCLELSEQHANTDFYFGIAKMTKAFINELTSTFNVLPMPRKLHR